MTGSHPSSAQRNSVSAERPAVSSRIRGVCVIVLACVATFLAACQPLSRVARDPNLPDSVERLRTTTDILDVAEVDLPVESTTDVEFLLRGVEDSDPLPDIRLRNVSVTESGLFDAMNLIAASANLSLSIEGGARGLERAVAVDRYVTRLLASEAALEEYPGEAKAARAAAEREVLANLYLRRKSEELVMAVTQTDIDKFYKEQVRNEDYASYKLNYYLTQDDLDATAMEHNIATNDAEAKGKFVPVNREGDGFIPLASTPDGLGALVARAKVGDYLRAVRVRDGFLILNIEQVRAGRKPAQTKDLNDQIRNPIAQDILNKEILARREKAQVKLKL